ncbi:MAG: hypothetical protein U5L05_00910 [Rubrivivax sp.]|nr:hypothetical protein [Rubrivivax sp.]
MTPAQTIARLPKAAAETSFDSLRALGVHHAQALSGQRWTDYNLHDPGVTILEAVTYALTELAYRADFTVADHLSDEHHRIAWRHQGLHLPQDAFPCRPTTATDYRRLLLDQMPGLDGVAFDVVAPADAAQGASGLYRLVLDASLGEDRAAVERTAREIFAAARNLCEDLGSVAHVEKRLCHLRADIEIGGARDPADIVAEFYERCATYLAAAVDFESCAAGLARQETLDHIFTGPATRNGIAKARLLERATQQTVFVTDLIARVRGDDVKEVHWLALEQGDGTASTSSLSWRDESGCWTLALAPPQGTHAVEGLVVRRNGNPVTVMARDVRRRFDDLRAARKARRHGLNDIALSCAPPAGQQPAVLPHYSVQNHFPALYGVGEQGMPESASAHDKARAHQLQAYLLLFEQLMAHGGAQLQHLRELFSVEGGGSATRWWHVLGVGEVPGIAELLAAPPERIEQDIFVPYDDRADRRNRLLDHLLALQGQTYAQNSLRQFSDHLAPAELDAYLLKNKIDFTRELPELGRDRAAAFDPARASWDVPGNSSGLQRQVSLLLGYPHGHSRPLAAALGERELVSAERYLAEASGSSAPAQLTGWSAALQRLDLETAQARRTPAQRHAERQRMPIARETRLPAPLLRCGARHDRYSWRPPADGAPGQLVLGPDEDHRFWLVNTTEGLDLAGALAHAGTLRSLLRQIDSQCEGMHVVEHLLLRPLGAAADDRTGADFHFLRLSVVFPAWTTRGQRRNFRQFAEETVRINCPSHLAAQCLWLEPGPMREFEDAYAHWLALRCQHAQAGGGASAAAEVDGAARVLVDLLSAVPTAGAAGG